MADRIYLSRDVQEKYRELPQLAMIWQAGVVTCRNVKGFLPEATQGSPAQFGGSDTWVDEEGNYFYGRTEFDSPDVDNDVLVDAREHYIKIGEFVAIKIHEAGDFDLYGTPVK